MHFILVKNLYFSFSIFFHCIFPFRSGPCLNWVSLGQQILSYQCFTVQAAYYCRTGFNKKNWHLVEKIQFWSFCSCSFFSRKPLLSLTLGHLIQQIKIMMHGNVILIRNKKSFYVQCTIIKNAILSGRSTFKDAICFWQKSRGQKRYRQSSHICG